MLMTGTSDLIRITTSSTADIDVQASVADITTTTLTPVRTNTKIASATTTTIITSPAASTQRQVKTIVVRNIHATDPNTVTVLHTDGTTSVIVLVATLAASESILYTGTEWISYDADGNPISAYFSDPTKAPIVSPTFTGTVTLPKTVEIQDTSADHQYVLAVSELTADRTVTLPLLTGADEFVFAAHTKTLTNKRVSPRTSTEASSATPTINTDNVEYHSITALAVAITSMTTNLSGTPTTNQRLWISITGTAARAITWGASFEASTVALPTTTVTTARLDVGFVWTGTIWRCVAVA